jgi:hypothetical protein
MQNDTTSQQSLLASFSSDGDGDIDVDCEQLCSQKEAKFTSSISFLLPLCPPGILIASWCIFLASVTLNAVLIYTQYQSSNDQTASASTATLSSFMGPSAYSGLNLDTPSVHYHHTDYWSENITKADELWDGIETNSMVVALTDEFADAHDLPRSDRFPWDAKKGRYFVKVFHQLHCLVSKTLP